MSDTPSLSKPAQPLFWSVTGSDFARSIKWAATQRTLWPKRRHHERSETTPGAGRWLWRIVSPFFFIAIEKEPPYGVAIFRLNDDAVAIGQDETLADLRRLKVCRETDIWPNIEPEVTELGLPKWYGGAR